MTNTREEMLLDTFVTLSDTLVEDFDLVEVLSLLSERCVELFDAEAAGVMLVGAGGALQLLASSSERMRLLELFELQRDEGPCPDCYRSGEPVVAADLRQATERWPTFAAEALRTDFQAVHALPMRVRRDTIGALNLFRNTVGTLSEADLRAARALADVATLSILQHRSPGDAQGLARQLQQALNVRVVIEQAKGVLAERSKVNMEEAFLLLRRYARDQHQRLNQVALDVTEGTLQASALGTAPRP
ncbi:MAG TPA: GAF and ANTAR domain-containing protein [Acidimicrobiia bacterium]|nr:GAF and ANTAR domain-containing protein [Acidimicrobiia bacterium]